MTAIVDHCLYECEFTTAKIRMDRDCKAPQSGVSAHEKQGEDIVTESERPIVHLQRGMIASDKDIHPSLWRLPFMLSPFKPTPQSIGATWALYPLYRSGGGHAFVEAMFDNYSALNWTPWRLLFLSTRSRTESATLIIKFSKAGGEVFREKASEFLDWISYLSGQH